MKYYHIKEESRVSILRELTSLFETAPELMEGEHPSFSDTTWENVLSYVVVEDYWTGDTQWARVYYDGTIRIAHDLLDEFMRLISDEYGSPMYIKTTYY